ncbi:MAG: flagellar hook-associated protein 3 [Treponema sp.]|jgi:flagellar hook-associated protein 3 FlgL|nr:flagellar hook-associated protein 3 [Treponema sp.]
MLRIATNMPNDDMQYRLRRQEEALARTQAQIAGQSRLQQLRIDPLAASHTVRYDSYLARLERFEKNTLYAVDHLDQTDSYLQHANDVLQRIREIAVQGANGVYTQEDMQYMATEINELLKEIVATANIRGADGAQIFSGDKGLTEPFRIVEGPVNGGGEPMIVRVEYRGAGASRRTEISDGSYIDLDISGGEAFWAENMQIFSSVDASDYRVTQSGAIFIDGVEINLSPGDTVGTIIAKINDSPAPVKAYLDVSSRGINLQGTNPHLIRVEDALGSTVMQDLGIIRATADASAPNWNPNARVAGGSAFDMIIDLRDALFRGDYNHVGSRGLTGLDQALNNIETRITEIGSRSERAHFAWKKVNAEIPQITEGLDRENGINMATAAVDLSMMDFAYKATLQTAARIIPTTLLDFLR